MFLLRAGRMGQAVLLDLRRRLFDHVQRLSPAFHERYTSGRVIARLTSDVDALDELLDEGLDGLVTALLSVVSIGVILLILDLPLALVTLATFLPLYALSRWFRSRSFAAYRRTRVANAALIVQFVESLAGIRAVQAFRREPRNGQIFEQLNQDVRVANARSFRLMALFVPGVAILGTIATVTALLYGGIRVLDGELQVGVLTSFLLYLRRFFDPMQDIAVFFNSFQSASAALEKLSGVLEEKPSVPEPEHPTPLPDPRGEVDVPVGAVRLPGRGGAAGPRRDRRRPGRPWRWSARPAPARPRSPGCWPASTTRTTGQVLLDGVDLRQLSEVDLRRSVVLVTQENFLFSGSVADNIAFGRPGATRAQVVAAAEAIGAHEFIEALPEGYDTDVRKRGGRLSAGQRQLVAFARAFLADPAVLILDEATSSLDVPSERAVQRALRTILAERTSLIIAHRLSTVEIADRVLVLEAGRVVEDGSPDELVGGEGRFAGLHRAWRDSLV